MRVVSCIRFQTFHGAGVCTKIASLSILSGSTHPRFPVCAFRLREEEENKPASAGTCRNCSGRHIVTLISLARQRTDA